LRFEIPQRRIQRVARGARWESRLQFVPSHAGDEVATQCLRLAEHRGHGFAVAAVGHRFAAPDPPALAQLDRHHIDGVLDAARCGTVPPAESCVA
jgi:hypothetical protein